MSHTASLNHPDTDTLSTTSKYRISRPIRILIVAPYFYPKIGGLEQYAYAVGTYLQKSGRYQLFVVTSNNTSNTSTRETINGMTVYRLPARHIISNTPVNIRWYKEIAAIIKDIRPDIIHAHSPVPFIADIATLAAGDIPVVLTYHAGSMRKGRPLIDLVIRLYESTVLKYVFHKATAIAYVSRDFGEHQLKRYAHKTIHITPGVDTDRFHPTPLPRPSNIVTFVGRLELSSQWKGVETLLHAMAIVVHDHPELSLEIVGGGDALPHYQQMARQLGIETHVLFCGALTGDALTAAYARSSVVVLPSTSNAEAFGMVLIEAMASGRPVIGSRIGGIPQVIDHEKNGLLVPPGNADALAHAILCIMSDASFAQTLAEASIEKSKRFDWNIIAETYAALFERILTQTHHAIHVTHVIGYYPPHTGGMEIVAEELARRTSRRGFPVQVLTSTIGLTPQKTTAESGYAVTRLMTSEIAHTPIIWSLPFHLLFLPKKSILHIHIAQAGIPEITTCVAKLRGYKTVGHFHLDIGPSGSAGAILPFYKKHFLGRALRSMDRIIVFSDEQRRFLIETYAVDTHHIVIIPNGVGEEFFFREQRPLPKESLNLLFVGRLSQQKRLDRIIDALALVDIPYHLTIVGDGDMYDTLVTRAHDKGVQNISFVGKKTGEELRAYYRKADLFVLPSDVEGMPLVVLEAMAAGLPILASDVMGLHELVSGTGILVKHPSPETFAAAIRDIWHNTNTLHTRSIQSLQKADTLSWDMVVDHIEALYNTLY